MSEHKMIRVRVEDNISWSLEGKVSDSISALQDYLIQYGPDVTMDINCYEDEVSITLYHSRLETDEELQERLKCEERRRIYKESMEIAEYARLKAIFEGKS